MQGKPQLNNRQEQIYNDLQNQRELKVNDLTKKYGVVEMTIRRDLEKMEKLGLIKRTFGGAIPADPDVGLKKRQHLNTELKDKIGKKAAEYVHNGDAIFLDAGTTTPTLLKYIPSDWNLTIATNAINVALQVNGPQMEKVLLGGDLRETTLSTVGPATEMQLENMSFDKTFLSASGLTIENGLGNVNIYEVQVKRKAMKQSKEVIFLMDHTKFGKQLPHRITMYEGFDRIITDKRPSEEYCYIIEKMGIELIVCDE